MGGWKKEYGEDEIEIFEKGLLSKRGDYWHFRLWLEKEKKYVRRSLKTRKRHIAVELAKEMYLEMYANIKQGKSFYSITCEQAAEKYLEARLKDYEVGQISLSRYRTIRTHLKTWNEFIGKKKKLRELKRKDCENYYEWRYERTDGKVSLITIDNEQMTINSMMKWLKRADEVEIDGFDFKKLKKDGENEETVRRQTLTNEEYNGLIKTMRRLCSEKHSKMKVN